MGGEQGKRGGLELAALWVAWCLALVVLWLVFVGTLGLSEVLAGVVAAGIAAIAATAVLAPGSERFSPPVGGGSCALVG